MPISTGTLVIVVVCVVTLITLFVAIAGLSLNRVAARDEEKEAAADERHAALD